MKEKQKNTKKISKTDQKLKVLDVNNLVKTIVNDLERDTYLTHCNDKLNYDHYVINLEILSTIDGIFGFEIWPILYHCEKNNNYTVFKSAFIGGGNSLEFALEDLKKNIINNSNLLPKFLIKDNMLCVQNAIPIEEYKCT